MESVALKQRRRAAGLSQVQLAKRLGTSQGYVSLLERGLRKPSPSIERRLVRVLKLPPTARPFTERSESRWTLHESSATKSLATLGYPGFAYMGRSSKLMNPAEVLLRTLAAERVDSRVAEALPWLVLRFEDFDVRKTVELAYRRRLQNRLGFVTALAKQVAEANPGYADRLPELDELLAALEPLRLANEDDLGQRWKSERMRASVRQRRSDAATHWNVLSSLDARQLRYVN